MNDAHGFRVSLRMRLLRIVALSAAGALAESVAACGPVEKSRTECFDSAATNGGTTGMGGGAGASGSGGAAGNTAAGGSGASANPSACPGPDEAMSRFELAPHCKILSIDGSPSIQDGKCCYPVTEQC